MQAIPQIIKKNCRLVMEHNSQLQKCMHTNANIMFGINKKKFGCNFFCRERYGRPKILHSHLVVPNSILNFKKSTIKKNCSNLEKTDNAQFGILGFCSKDEGGLVGIFRFVVQGRV